MHESLRNQANSFDGEEGKNQWQSNAMAQIEKNDDDMLKKKIVELQGNPKKVIEEEDVESPSGKK